MNRKLGGHPIARAEQSRIFIDSTIMAPSSSSCSPSSFNIVPSLLLPLPRLILLNSILLLHTFSSVFISLLFRRKIISSFLQYVVTDPQCCGSPVSSFVLVPPVITATVVRTVTVAANGIARIDQKKRKAIVSNNCPKHKELLRL